MERSIDSLLAPRTARGVRWLPDQQQDITLPGETYRYQLDIQNMSEIMTDTFELRIEPYHWVTSLVTKTLELGPLRRGQTVLKLSKSRPTPCSIRALNCALRPSPAATATPGPPSSWSRRRRGIFLLVDDDRFYEREDVYKDTLDTLRLQYMMFGTPP